MKNVELNIEVRQPFGNLFRDRTALIIVENDRHKFLIGTKLQFYPPTIARFLGGGVDKKESDTQAAIRELYEELGVKLKPSQLKPLFIVSLSAEDENKNRYQHKVHMFYTNIGNTPYKPGDDVTTILELSANELYALGEAYEAIPDTLWYNGPEGSYAWADYAKLYGPIHKLGAQAVKEMQA